MEYIYCCIHKQEQPSSVADLVGGVALLEKLQFLLNFFVSAAKLLALLTFTILIIRKISTRAKNLPPSPVKKRRYIDLSMLSVTY